MNEDQIVDLIMKYDNKVVKHYKYFILQNFKCNSRSNNLLSERQYFILYIILYKKINTITEIASFLNLSKANISILIKKLEENKFIYKHKEGSFDSRVTHIEVTDEGKKIFAETRNSVSKMINDTIIVHVKDNDQFLKSIKYIKNTLNIDEQINKPEDVILLFFINIHQIISELYNAFLINRNISLSIAELKIITTISFVEQINFDGLTQNMGLSYSTLSLQVKKLEANGFIKKNKNINDARVTYLALTDKSTKIVNDLSNYKTEYIRNEIKQKSSDDLKMGVQLLVALSDLLDTIDLVTKTT